MRLFISGLVLYLSVMLVGVGAGGGCGGGWVQRRLEKRGLSCGVCPQQHFVL